MLTDNLHSVKDVAERLSVTTKTVKHYIATGKLEAYKIGGKYRISTEMLDSFLESSKYSVKSIDTRKTSGIITK